MKIILLIFLLLNIINSKNIVIYNNKICKLLITKELKIKKSGKCINVNNLYDVFLKDRDITYAIDGDKPKYISDKFYNDKKIIQYFGQYFNFINTSLYFKIKKEYINDEILYILIKNQLLTYNGNHYIFNRIKKIDNNYYIVLNTYNFKDNKNMSDLLKKIKENYNVIYFNYSQE